MDSVDELLTEITEITRQTVGDGFVALYVYGGVLDGRNDAWSDVDVCLVWKQIGEAPPATRRWMGAIIERYGHRVDPNSLPLDVLTTGGHWQFDFIVRALQMKSRLLLGDDVRGSLRAPPADRLRISAVLPACAWVRNLYAIPREEPIARQLPVLQLPLGRLPGGNSVWAVANTVTQLVRAIAIVEANLFCDSRTELEAALRESGEARLSECIAIAGSLRHQVPRFDDIKEVPLAAHMLCELVPELARRLGEALSNAGMEDPSWEPEGQPLYLPDGTKSSRAEHRFLSLAQRPGAVLTETRWRRQRDGAAYT